MQLWRYKTKKGRGHRVRIPHEVQQAEFIGASQFGWSSTNWSGYAVSSSDKGAYSSVSGSWTVPAVKAPPIQPVTPWQKVLQFILSLLGISTGKDVYSASWIGIDGFNNSNLIQTGTAQNYVNGKTQYYAWWEILPNPETVIDPSKYPVNAGDKMQANISKQSDGTWTIQLIDWTQGWTFAKKGVNYTGPQTSAEWIEEAPEVNLGIAALADYGETAFQSCMVNGGNPQLTAGDGGVMYQNNQVVSIPSLPGPQQNDFNIAYGSQMPKPPSS